MSRAKIGIQGPLRRTTPGWRIGCAGVSLLELLIALTISSVAISAAIHMFSAYGSRLTSQRSAMVSNQELRLGLGEARTILLSLQEISGLLQVPSALSFVEDHNVFDGRSGLDQRVISKVMNVLDEGLDALSHIPFADLLALGFASRNFIAG